MSRSTRRFRLSPGLLPAPAKNGELTALPGPIDPDIVEAHRQLVEGGFITCTRGRPGETGATYALAWLELDEPDRYSTEVRERHARNMLRWSLPGGTA